MQIKHRDQTYEYSIERLETDGRIPALIPTHDSGDLLRHCLTIMLDSGAIEDLYPVIIDDRSTEDLSEVLDDFKCGHIRIDHSYIFNYSANLNIGAQVLYEDGQNTALFMNNDCYIHNQTYLKQFILRHKTNKSDLSGTKLVYPPATLSFKDEVEQPERVQFGDGAFYKSLHIPVHIGRGEKPEHFQVNMDCITRGYITGAFNLVELKTFMDYGGYDMDLPGAFQDVLYSLQLLAGNRRVCYFGEDIFFYHDETTTRMDDWLVNGSDVAEVYHEKLKGLI